MAGKLVYRADCAVVATDRNGKFLDIIEFRGKQIDLRRTAIGRAKVALMQRFGPDCYTFVNDYA